MKSEYFILLTLLPNGFCSVLYKVAQPSRSYDGKSVIAQCSCINDGATLICLFLEVWAQYQSFPYSVFGNYRLNQLVNKNEIFVL